MNCWWVKVILQDMMKEIKYDWMNVNGHSTPHHKNLNLSLFEIIWTHFYFYPMSKSWSISTRIFKIVLKGWNTLYRPTWYIFFQSSPIEACIWNIGIIAFGKLWALVKVDSKFLLSKKAEIKWHKPETGKQAAKVWHHNSTLLYKSRATRQQRIQEVVWYE